MVSEIGTQQQILVFEKFIYISLQKGSKWEAANYFGCFEFLFCLLRISIGKQFALKCFRKNSCNFLLMHSMQNNIQIISLFRNTLNVMQSIHVKILPFPCVFIQRLEMGYKSTLAFFLSWQVIIALKADKYLLSTYVAQTWCELHYTHYFQEHKNNKKRALMHFRNGNKKWRFLFSKVW